MENQKNNYFSNFWSGFLIGGTLILFLSFMFGTKKGREYLKKILEISENLEENAISLLKDIENIELNQKFDNKTNHKKDKETIALPNIISRIKNRLTF